MKSKLDQNNGSHLSNEIPLHNFYRNVVFMTILFVWGKKSCQTTFLFSPQFIHLFSHFSPDLTFLVSYADQEYICFKLDKMWIKIISIFTTEKVFFLVITRKNNNTIVCCWILISCFQLSLIWSFVGVAKCKAAH